MDVAPTSQQVPQVPDALGELVKSDFGSFLRKFVDENGESVYLPAVQHMIQAEETTLYINHSHVEQYSEELLVAISNNYYRLDKYLRQAVKEFVVANFPRYEKDEKDQPRDFYVSFFNLPVQTRIRDMKTDAIGRLVGIRGTVVRTSTVHPELVVGTFRCMECNTLASNVEQQFKYTEPAKCSNPQCTNKTAFSLVHEQSRFVDFQKVRVQEPSEEIPSGSMPRSIDIILRHETVEKAKPGDKVTFVGCLVVIPDVAQLSASGGRTQLETRTSRREGYTEEGITGLKALGVRDLSYKMSFLATSVMTRSSEAGNINIRDEEANTASVVSELTQAERQEILDMKNDPDLYQKMAQSIAPNVWGHEEVKKGILLMLLGGVHKKAADGINLRGDINTCIVGDPSTAKSQFLKYVNSFVPRSVYTSGKASSAAGLTAAVVRDEDTNEFFIEAGALMLADNGICCIDEFDKMETVDQVAIHEAMEQQTISITKAGIQATLNARTSILAAANPIGGRYDKTKKLRQNVAMTGPIMSRFDLFFVILDEFNEVSDYHVARHITNIHMMADDSLQSPYTKEQLQRYLKFARTLDPKISPSASELLVKCYRELRAQDGSGVNKASYRITVRQLESMIRLAEARARLACDDEVRTQHVREAFRLLKQSILRVETEDIRLDDLEGIESLAQTPAQSEGQQQDADDMDTGDDGHDETKEKKTISYEEYVRTSNMIIHYIRQQEELQEDASDTTEERLGVRAGDVVRWWLTENKDKFSSIEETTEAAATVRLILARLVKVDRVLLAVGQVEPESEEDKGTDSEDNMLLVVHPNYTPTVEA